MNNTLNIKKLGREIIQAVLSFSGYFGHIGTPPSATLYREPTYGIRANINLELKERVPLERLCRQALYPQLPPLLQARRLERMEQVPRLGFVLILNPTLRHESDEQVSKRVSEIK